MAFKERRSAVRVPLNIWVEQTTETGELYYQRTANVSETGVYLDKTIPHPPGTIVNLKFTLPGQNEEISVIGEIVAHHDGDGLGMGVKFINPSKKVVELIREYVGRML